MYIMIINKHIEAAAGSTHKYRTRFADPTRGRFQDVVDINIIELVVKLAHGNGSLRLRRTILYYAILYYTILD